jgi:hypothetical protein
MITDFFDVADDRVRPHVRERQVTVIAIINRDNSTTGGLRSSDVRT